MRLPEYAQQIPVRVIGAILGIPEELADTFTGWVRDVLEFADDPHVSNGGCSASATTCGTASTSDGTTTATTS